MLHSLFHHETVFFFFMIFILPMVKLSVSNIVLENLLIIEFISVWLIAFLGLTRLLISSWFIMSWQRFLFGVFRFQRTSIDIESRCSWIFMEIGQCLLLLYSLSTFHLLLDAEVLFIITIWSVAERYILQYLIIWIVHFL